MYFETILAIFIFSLVPLAIKATSANAISICIFRLVLTSFLMCAFYYKKINFKLFFSFKKENLILWSLGVAFFFHWITYAFAVKWGGPAIGVLGVSTYGPQLVILGFLFQKNKISKKDISCLLISMFGIFLVVPSWDFHNQSFLGLLLALFSATFFALMPILHKKLIHINFETRIFAQFFSATLGFLFLFPYSNFNFSKNDWGLLLFLAIFGTFIAHGLWAKITSKVTPIHASLIYYTITPLTFLFTHFLLKENFNLRQIIGAMIVISSGIFHVYKKQAIK